MLSNFLANSPMTWLNYKMVPYAAKKKIIPEPQVATNQGVQTRDMCYSDQNKQPIYALSM